MVPPYSDRVSRAPPYSRTPDVLYPYGTITLYGRPFQNGSGFTSGATGLVRIRSPLLTESRLMSFPPATKMFQFAGFASRSYVFTPRYLKRGGFPHSEISGLTPARGSPELIATCYVLHRLSVPRHPPNALLTLDPTKTVMHGNQAARDWIPGATLRVRRNSRKEQSCRYNAKD